MGERKSPSSGQFKANSNAEIKKKKISALSIKNKQTKKSHSCIFVFTFTKFIRARFFISISVIVVKSTF